VYTRDLQLAMRFARRLRTGLVNINETPDYWELNVPYGGAAGTRSGYGRLGGLNAFRSVMDLRSTIMEVGSADADGEFGMTTGVAPEVGELEEMIRHYPVLWEDGGHLFTETSTSRWRSTSEPSSSCCARSSPRMAGAPACGSTPQKRSRSERRPMRSGVR
jgi:hypothetical protein